MARFAALALLLLLLLHLPVEARSAGQPPQAAALPLVATLAGQPLPALTDGSTATKATLTQGDVLLLSAEAEIHGLYLRFDGPRSANATDVLRRGGHELPVGGFLHQYIELPPAFRESGDAPLELVVGGEPITLCDIAAFGSGEPPPWVQRWNPPDGNADLLLLSTHADDEHLFFGGILPTYAGERGYAVQVAYLTNHWGEPYRPHELLDGLWEVGVRRYPVFGPFPDAYAENLAAAEALYTKEAVEEYIAGLLQDFRPLVAVGHDLNGEYGHGAHILGARELLDAVNAASGEPWQPQKLYLHLYPQAQLTLDWDIPLAAFGGATAFETASKGYSHHRSQHQWFQMEPAGPYDCRKFGLAFTAIGPDRMGGDLFENIDETRLRGYLPPEPEPQPTTVPDSEPARASSPPPPPQEASIPPEPPPVRPPFNHPLTLALPIAAGLLLIVFLTYAFRKRK